MSASGELGTRAWRQLRAAILERDGGRCQIGGPGCAGYATEVDHITSRADGGAMWDPANLRAACRRCNLARGAVVGNQRKRSAGFAYRTPAPPIQTRF